METSASCLETPRPTAFTPSRLLGMFGVYYCRTFHRAISRPVHGKYRCWRCLREFELGW